MTGGIFDVLWDAGVQASPASASKACTPVNKNFICKANRGLYARAQTMKTGVAVYR